MPHHVVAIVPACDMEASTDFYRLLGFEVAADFGGYRILEDKRGWHLHLNHMPGWPPRVEDYPFGLYLYVDAVAERVRDRIIEPGAPHAKPWGTYEFAISNPTGVLVRIGRAMG
ncbi:glyoxalase [Sphingomonas sp. CFBP8993]|uniref:VOC family protein n=1 Tax=Sphingomonas sp. CFBP8993 TaxID=3096526 RepID=UPI002A6B37E3|nr:VOC family protein [Sphingomonas sp. CFBP8993]MDY0957926.1 glyoxalase [Sphingomonas sp. CFBP8993]